MLKLWGAGLIFAAGLYGILLRKRENEARKKQLWQWIELLEAMGSEIRWHHVSLSAFLQRQPITNKVSQYMKSKYTLQQSWVKIINDVGDKGIEEILKNIRFSGDQEYLLASIALAIEQLRDLERNRRQKTAIQEKIQNAAVFSVAGLLIILLL